MKLRGPYWLLRGIWRSWQNEVTRHGKFMVGALFFAGAGALSLDIPIYRVFCVLAALATVSLVAGLAFWPKVKLQGRLPERTAAGQTISAPIHVRHGGRRPAFDLGLGLFGLPDGLEQVNTDTMVRCLSPGESTSVDVTLHAARRGLYELPRLRAYTSFPFNFLRIGAARHAMGSLLVLPTFHRAAGIDLPVATRYQPGGIALTSNIGESPEYIGNREYIPGEPARRLDFRSWARLGKPVVREYHEEYYCRVALILDTFIPPDRKPTREGFVNLEAAVSLAATVADVLSGGEYLIDLFAAGPELYVFRAGRHTAHFENILEILACVDACRQNPFNSIAPAIADELNNISTAICVLLDWDETRRRLAQSVIEAGCRLKVVVVRDGDLTTPLDDLDVIDCSQYSVAQIREGGFDVL
jgi:uncharacterized protein (DUF58 family)